MHFRSPLSLTSFRLYVLRRSLDGLRSRSPLDGVALSLFDGLIMLFEEELIESSRLKESSSAAALTRCVTTFSNSLRFRPACQLLRRLLRSTSLELMMELSQSSEGSESPSDAKSQRLTERLTVPVGLHRPTGLLRTSRNSGDGDGTCNTGLRSHGGLSALGSRQVGQPRNTLLELAEPVHYTGVGGSRGRSHRPKANQASQLWCLPWSTQIRGGLSESSCSPRRRDPL